MFMAIDLSHTMKNLFSLPPKFELAVDVTLKTTQRYSFESIPGWGSQR